MSETSIDALLGAVRTHLREQVMPELEGFDAFGVRVAANAIGIAQRELAVAHTLAEYDRQLADFAPGTDAATPAQCVSRALRDGTLAPNDALLSLLRQRTMVRIGVDNPRYTGLAEAQRRWEEE